MINIHFAISNPWHKNKFKNLYNFSHLVSKNKAIEAELLYCDHEIVNFQSSLTFREDHAGFCFVIGVFGFSISFNFYDTRHWDTIKGKWEQYDNDTVDR